MFSKAFKIVSPKTFEVYVDEVKLKEQCAIIKIDKAAICKADLRYYLGKRNARILGLKYPMNLLHEAIGTVIKDSTGQFQCGDKVALVPNLTTNCDKSNCKYKVCENKYLGENYCPKALFASSNCNGFSTQFIVYPVSNLVKIDDSVDTNVAVFSELMSVACGTIRRINIEESNIIAIWGDGVVGYILASILKTVHKGTLIAIGKHKDKLEQFPVDKFYLTGDQDIKKECIDLSFECVGGLGSEHAINEIMDVSMPGGKVIFTGVTEENVAINTRKILEKGLHIFGVTRSNVEDYMVAVNFLKDKNIKSSIEKLILGSIEVNDIVDFYNCFERELDNKKLGKYIININL